jgi:acyl dehydratase
MGERSLEDFVVGQTFVSGRLRVTREQTKAFAADFDPQPFHLDEAAAQNSFFKGLAASGWHAVSLAPDSTNSAGQNLASEVGRVHGSRWRYLRCRFGAEAHRH